MDRLGVRDLDVRGCRVLVRVDFNVPLAEGGRITDDSRIVAALPTLEVLLKGGASLVLMSHLGRPKGRAEASMSLAPCARRLSELLGRPVAMAPDCVGNAVERMASALAPGQVLMLENLRFHKAETDPETDPSFAERLARLGDLYVNDAFGAAHRAHSSTYQVAQLFPGKAAAGLLLAREVEVLGRLAADPARPFVAIIGGAKVSSKLEVLRSLVGKVDALAIVGAMAFTFAFAKGVKVGGSLVEPDLRNEALEIAKLCSQRSVDLILPADVLIADKIDNTAAVRIIPYEQDIPDGWIGVDIGPATITKLKQVVNGAKTVFWNGAPGIFETPSFAKGTLQLAKLLANAKAATIAGGGDTLASIHQAEVQDKFSHLSTGGGASLELIQFGTLPALEVLTKSNKEHIFNMK